jgi:hypothetical protein
VARPEAFVEQPALPTVVKLEQTQDTNLPQEPEASADATHPSDDTVWVEGVAVSRQELSYKLESKFQEDGPADRAGRELERNIAEQFTGHDAPAATLNKAECRGRMCRIELSASDKYAASQAFEGLYRGALIAAGSALAPAYDAMPDGRVRLVIYVAKQGALDLG